MAAVLINKSPSVVVKPSSEGVTSATSGHITLTSYDTPNIRWPVTAFLVFERPIDDAVKTIKRGLSLALVPYYPISGRLATGADEATTIDCTGGTGVLFVAAAADAALHDVDLRRQLEELAVFFPAADDPLLLVQVTVFACGGFVVGVTWDHAVADGRGMSQFLRAVSELARGTPSLAVVPVREDAALAPLPLAFQRVHRLVNSLQPSPLILLNITVPCSLIRRIKQEFATVNDGQPCTVFEAVTAVLWRCRTRAVMQEEDRSAPSLLSFVADTRRHAGAKDGYYGNCCYFAPSVVATSAAVAGGDVLDVIRMIRRAKGRIPGYYDSSKVDEEVDDARRLQELAEAGLVGYSNMLGVTCWRNLGMDKADFGGGTPARVMWYMKQGMARLPCCVSLPCGESFSVTSLCVKEEHAPAFQRELAAMYSS